MGDAVEIALAELATLDRTELSRLWTTVFGSPAPTRCRYQLLRSALAWDIQAKAAGATRDAHGARRKVRTESIRDASRPSVGTVLIREWRGGTHRVTVLVEGFQYRSDVYGSLSAIARAITGTNWSGRRFFGLRT